MRILALFSILSCQHDAANAKCQLFGEESDQVGHIPCVDITSNGDTCNSSGRVH